MYTSPERASSAFDRAAIALRGFGTFTTNTPAESYRADPVLTELLGPEAMRAKATAVSGPLPMERFADVAEFVRELRQAEDKAGGILHPSSSSPLGRSSESGDSDASDDESTSGEEDEDEDEEGAGGSGRAEAGGASVGSACLMGLAVACCHSHVAKRGYKKKPRSEGSCQTIHTNGRFQVGIDVGRKQW